MPICERLGEYLIAFTQVKCLEKLRLSKVLIVMLVFDAVTSVCFLFPTIVLHFLYTNPGGRAGFVDRKWNWYKDIFKFRRNQEWERLQTIDWEKDDRYFINESRYLLDEQCSRYENKFAGPGDPGDYLKEVAGFPNESGYNERRDTMIRLFLATISIIYFGLPILLLGLWWKTHTMHILLFYVFTQIFPMILSAAVTSMAGSHLMCAINVIYEEKSIYRGLAGFTVILWIYSLVKFSVVFLHCVEQRLTRKRKDFGFKQKPKAGTRKNKVGPSSKSQEGLNIGRHSLDPTTVQLMEGDDTNIKGKKLVTDILALGSDADGSGGMMDDEDDDYV